MVSALIGPSGIGRALVDKEFTLGTRERSGFRIECKDFKHEYWHIPKDRLATSREYHSFCKFQPYKLPVFFIFWATNR